MSDITCVCGHTKDHHYTTRFQTKGCMHVASVPSRAKKQYGRGRNHYIKCDCKRFRLLTTKEDS